jgi:excisionase family DNA binding protein
MIDHRSRRNSGATPARDKPEMPPVRAVSNGPEMSTREAAHALGVSERTVRRAIARGALAAVKHGRGYLISREALARYAVQRERPPAPWPRIVALPSPTALPSLPVPGSRFVGRDVDLATLFALLTDPEARLVTLTGPGGIGKTRLGLAAAARARDAFPDGACFVDLAAITTPSLVVPAIAQTIGLRVRAGHDPRCQLGAFLRARRLLLVLDNFEQILDAAPEVAWLIAAAPDLSILVTSRAPLRVAGERELPVPPLSLPAANATPENLLAADAGRLFVERARAHDPGFAVDAESAPIVAEICSRLDGLPLAIELAAARCNVLPPRHLRDHLERRLPLLTGGARDAPARHRTMRDAIAWSYDLLAPAEQRAFRRLAVFASGFTLTAAAAVLGEGDAAPADGGDPVVTLDLVAALVDQSLLARDHGPDGEPRFRLLETIREYGLERLAAPEAAAARAAHARYVLRMAQTLHPLANTRSTRVPLDRLAADDANVRDALLWLDEHGQTADVAAMVAACWPLWYFLNRLDEAEHWLARTLSRIGVAVAGDRARLLMAWADLLLLKGELARAETAFATALPVVREVGDPFDLAMALLLSGAALNHAGKYAQGEAQLAESLALAETILEPTLRAAVTGRALANLSDSARGQGDIDLAAARSEEALRRYDGQGLELAETRVLMDLGHIAEDRGDQRLAVAHFLRCIDHTGEHGELRLVAESLEGIANAASAWGQTRTALLLFGAAAALRTRIGVGVSMPIDAARTDRALAALRDAAGYATVAATLAEGRVLPFREAVAMAATVTVPDGLPAARPTREGQRLTRREREVLQLMVDWRTDRQIAEALFLSPRTVSWHVRSILAKLGATSRREVVSEVRAHGLPDA